MSYRLEVWKGSIDLATCSPEEYDTAVCCSEPTAREFDSRVEVDAWLDAIERNTIAMQLRGPRVSVEVFLYVNGRLTFTYRRDRAGRFVPAGSKDAIA